jgi:hypothetical protein
MEPPVLLFREDRSLRSAYVWIMLVILSSVILGTLAWMVVRQVIQGIPFGDEPLSNTSLLAGAGLVFVAWAALLALCAFAKLQVEVTTRGLFVRLWPLQRKVRQIPLDGATHVWALQFRPLLDYGGYGIRRTRRGTAYTLGSGEGVRIDYDTGYHLVIESGHPLALEEAIMRCAEANPPAPDTAD